MAFDLQHLWEAATPYTLFIFAIMLVMGVMSVYVGIERLVTLNKARNQSRDLAEALSKPLADNDIAKSLKLCSDEQYKSSYLGNIMKAGLAEINTRFDRHGVNAALRAIERQSTQEDMDLRRGMNILATVGSTAPFVGLVGTIFGIINAFGAMASGEETGLAAVSGGISEALVATAVGIFVAIVGVWLFNFFTARLEIIDNDISISVQEFTDWCEKRLLAGPSDDPTEQVLATKGK
jgi:biopolymer transport protein ExbB/biopolymer transport protein TolQ